MRYYDELAVYQRNGFDIIVDKSYEDLDPKDCFDDECFDLKDMYRDIECGNLDWFINRRPDGFQFECSMDAQDAVNDSLLTYLVMVKYFNLAGVMMKYFKPKQEANTTGAGF